MNADLSYQPESGIFDEVHFEQDTVWNSQQFSWVRFEDSEYQDWYGSFRGAPLGHLAISELTGQVLIPTEDGTYLVDINSRKLLKFFGSEYQIMKVTIAPNGRSFILASFHQLYRTTEKIQLEKIQSPVDMDFIKFKGVNELTIEFEYEDLKTYEACIAFLNCKTWKIE